MRIGQILKLTPENVIDQKLILHAPKSENEAEIVFIPRRISDRLHKYIQDKGIKSNVRVFPITYAAAQLVVERQASWLELSCGLMILGGMLPHMLPGRVFRLKSSVR